MYSIFILCVIAAASAAPHYGYHHHGDFQDPGFHGPPGFGRPPPPGFGRPPPPPYPGFGEDVFDARTFWSQLADEMKELDDMLKDFYQHFPSSVSSEGLEGGQYKIVIPLAGYKEEEIAVKARTGVLMIQAVHKTEEGNQRTYLDVRTLPECVDLSGTWTYDKDVLTIQFPVKKSEESTEISVTQLLETQGPQTEASQSREEMGNDDNDNLDVDVGNRGDNDQDKEVETNEIPDRRDPDEATTYAVDLKNEVEFVPVSY